MVLLVLLLADNEVQAAATVLKGLALVAPGRRVAVVEGQAPVRTLTPLTTATHLTGVAHLSNLVTAQDLYPRLGHHLYGIHVQLEVDDRTPEGYVMACVWGDTATRTSADLGDYAAFSALDCPVEVQHYFLSDTTGQLQVSPPEPGSEVTSEAWGKVDPASIADHIESTATGQTRGPAWATPMQLNGKATKIDAKGADELGASLTERRQPPMAEGSYRLTSRFGETQAPRSSAERFGGHCGGWPSGVHTGLDLAGPWGAPVMAAARGQVISTGYQGRCGNQIMVAHDHGYQSTYNHLSTTCVSVGDTVSAGDQIGECGSTGDSTGAHLHFEVKKDFDLIDPENWLGWRPRD